MDEVVVERWWERVVSRHTQPSVYNTTIAMRDIKLKENINNTNNSNVYNLTAIGTKRLKKTNK